MTGAIQILLVPLFGLHTHTVGDIASIKGGLPLFHWPQVPLTLDTLKIVFPYALVMAMVGLLETLLTLNLVDEITASEGQTVAVGALLGEMDAANDAGKPGPAQRYSSALRPS